MPKRSASGRGTVVFIQAARSATARADLRLGLLLDQETQEPGTSRGACRGAAASSAESQAMMSCPSTLPCSARRTRSGDLKTAHDDDRIDRSLLNIWSAAHDDELLRAECWKDGTPCEDAWFPGGGASISATGAASRLVVVDLDVKHDAARAWRQTYGERMPQTRRQRGDRPSPSPERALCDHIGPTDQVELLNSSS